MTAFQVIQIVISIFVPVVLVIGVYVNLKDAVIRNQERISSIKEDIAEIKGNVKDIKDLILK